MRGRETDRGLTLYLSMAERHQQQEAVQREQDSKHGENAADPQEQWRGGDDRHRAQHDRDLVCRFGVLEIRVLRSRVIAALLPFARLGEQLLLAVAGRWL